MNSLMFETAAAAAIGCAVAEIAKSLVFRGAESGQAVLIIASGANRVDPAKAEAMLGEAIGRADADFVRAETGFAIGGVPPFGHEHPIAAVMDPALDGYEEVWAAAGTPTTVFAIAPGTLAMLADALVAPCAEDAPARAVE